MEIEIRFHGIVFNVGIKVAKQGAGEISNLEFLFELRWIVILS